MISFSKIIDIFLSHFAVIRCQRSNDRNVDFANCQRRFTTHVAEAPRHFARLHHRISKDQIAFTIENGEGRLAGQRPSRYRVKNKVPILFEQCRLVLIEKDSVLFWVCLVPTKMIMDVIGGQIFT